MRISANDIITRLKSALKIKSDAELADVMNITASGLSTWKRRDSVDHNAIIEVCVKNNIDLNGIFVGSVGVLPTERKESPHVRNKDELLIESLQRNVSLLEDRLKKTEALLDDLQRQLGEARDRISALTQKRAG